MADVQIPAQDDVLQDIVKKEEIIHEEINLPTSPVPQSPTYQEEAVVSEPTPGECSTPLVTAADDNNDLQCQEVLMDMKDEVEMGAEVEVGAEPPRKRGRGRPKGSTSQARIHHIKNTTSLRSSPRGEPQEDRSSSIKSPSRQACPDIIAHTVASPRLSSPSTPGTKRGRGRPPKVKLPQPYPEDQIAQLSQHLNNLNEVMNNPLLAQGGPPNLMMTPHQILLQQHQLYEQTRRLIQQQQMLLAQHQQVALAAGNQSALSSPAMMGHSGGVGSTVIPSSGGTKRGRGRPRGSATPKPPKVPKVKITDNPDGTPKQKRPYKKRQPKLVDGEAVPKTKRKYTRRPKNTEGTDNGKSQVDSGAAPATKEKVKRERKPKNQSTVQFQSEEKTSAKKERRQKERKPREKKPRKGKNNASVLPTPIAIDDRDSDGGSSTDSVVFCSEEPPPPIMSSPTYSSNSGSNNNRHTSTNKNNHKSADRPHNSGTNVGKNVSGSGGAEGNNKHKKGCSSPVISRLEDSSSDTSSGSTSSDDSGSSSSSDGDSSSSSSDEGDNNNDTSSGGSRSPTPSSSVRKNNVHTPQVGDTRTTSAVNAGDGDHENEGPRDNTNGGYNHRSAESPSWWYSSHNNDTGDTESSGEEGEGGSNSYNYNSNSPPPRSPSSASSESPDKSYQCHVCRKWFSSPVTLRIHKRSHQTKPNSGGGGGGSGGRAPRRYECDCCEATFTRRERLEQHRSEKHRGTLTERCEVCGRGFEDEEQQKKHLATHTADERAGRCGECGVTYSSWDQLRRHRSVHTPPASYVCNLCRKSFTYSHSLSRHLSNHSKAVYRCVVCKMSFNDYDSLAQHLNSHLDRYKQLKTT